MDSICKNTLPIKSVVARISCLTHFVCPLDKRRACCKPMDDLPPSDPYRRVLAAWAADVDETDDGSTTRPRQPPAPDLRKGSSTVRASREAAHAAAMSRWSELHAGWLTANDERKRARQASYNAQQDWKEAKRQHRP